MKDNLLIQKLEKIEHDLAEIKLMRKDVLNFSEACKYLDVSQSCLYKFTSKNKIPHYSPGGKKLYFKRSELDEWLLSKRKNSNEDVEISQLVANYLIKTPKTYNDAKQLRA